MVGDPEAIREKAEDLIARSPKAKKVRDHVSWPGIIIFGTCIVLMLHAVATEVIV